MAAVTFELSDRLTDLANAYPSSVNVLNALGYHGALACTIQEVAEALNRPAQEVLLDLAMQCVPVATVCDEDYGSLLLVELVDDICRNHHQLLRSELARLGVLIQSAGVVAQDAGQVYMFFRALVEEHLLYEEKSIFPLVETLQEVGTETFFNNDKLMREMCHDHDGIQEGFAELDATMAAVQWPTEALRSAVADLVQGLHEDHQVHQNKEDEFLMPAILAQLERRQRRPADPVD